MSEFGWAFIGAGNIADKVAKEITKSGRHKLVGCYSRTKSKADKLCDMYGGKSYDSIEKVLNANGVDGVYIATPHSVHYKYLMSCIENGKPVLCEKSFTVNKKQAEKVLETAENQGVYIMEGMWTRFNPVIRQVLEWVSNGKIGIIKEVEANFCVPLCFSKPYISDRVYKPEYAGGALLDLGVYTLTFAHMLLGNPENIRSNTTLKNGVDIHNQIELEYDNAGARLTSSFEVLKSYKGIIKGTKGKIIVPMFYKPAKAVLKIKGQKRQTINDRAGFIYEFDAFAEDIRQNKIENSIMTHKNTLDIMEIMDSIRKQAGLNYGDIESV